MQRRTLLSTITGGLAVPAPTPADAFVENEARKERGDSPFRHAWREQMEGQIASDFKHLSDLASDGDLAMLAQILVDWKGMAGGAQRESALSYAIDCQLGHPRAHIQCDPEISGQVAALVETLEVLRKKHRPRHSAGNESERDALIGAVAAFAYEADRDQVESLSEVVAEHFRRLKNASVEERVERTIATIQRARTTT